MEKLRSPESIRPIKKLFIAQRGEIAVRTAQACDKRGIAAVIPVTLTDTNPIASRMALDRLDKGWEIFQLPGSNPNQNFTNPDRIIAAAKAQECDAIFLGYGFLSESVSFRRQCEEEGIRVLAPPSRAMDVTSNKINAKNRAREVKIGRLTTIPVVEGSGDLKSVEEAIKAAADLKYPVMLKDPDSGGGKNPVARNQRELEAAYVNLKGKPENKQVFLERYIENAVHIEVQIVADKYGNVVSLGERDCTMQRQGQKIIEEAPSPQISQRLRNILQLAAVNFAKNIGYQGVGTWEFIIDRDRKGRGGDPAWYFMEVNPRLQVEHRVTEAVTKVNGVNVDIVDLMMDIEEGKILPFTQDQVVIDGHAIEFREYAENPDRNFEPSFGKVTVLECPVIEGVEVARAVEEGDTLYSFFDHTISLRIARGSTREVARNRLLTSVTSSRTVGVSTNLTFGADMLSKSEFINGRVTTQFIEREVAEATKRRLHSASLINGGVVIKQDPSMMVDSTRLQNVLVIPARVEGRENKEQKTISYEEYLEEVRKRSGKDVAAEYYIIQRDGIQFVVYDMDFNVKGGAFGPQEGNIFVDACKLAYDKKLPLITISRSGGMDNRVNNASLRQMRRTIAAARRKYPSKLFINIYAGPTYGGVPASFAGVADIKMAVNSEGTMIGFSGPYPVAKEMRRSPASPRAVDAYKVLPEDPHSPVTHYQNRNLDIMVNSLEEAGDAITHIIHLNKEYLKEAFVNPNYRYQPKEPVAFQESYGRALRYDRPGTRMSTWISRAGDFFKRYVPETYTRPASLEPLLIAQRMDLLARGDRPTVADLIHPSLGLFDDSRLIGHPPLNFGDKMEQYPSIIGAIAKFDNLTVFVLGQQTQRIFEPESQRWLKKYDPQKPADWEYALRMIKLARKLRLPLLLLGDTNGADNVPESEARGQSNKMAEVCEATDNYPFAVVAGNLGLKGSGGGEDLIGKADWAFDAENALSFVSTPMVQYWILTNKWIEDTASDEERAELVWFIEQLKDATAEKRKEMKMIDAIVAEGAGGAHLHPQLFARNIRREVVPVFRNLLQIPEIPLLDRRWERIEEPERLISVPFSP